MYHMVLFLTTPHVRTSPTPQYFLISSGLGFPFSTSSSSIPNFLVVLILSATGVETGCGSFWSVF